MKTNTKAKARSTARTHEGARALSESPIPALRRVLNAHMLWEDGFYLDGVANGDALKDAVLRSATADLDGTVGAIYAARSEMNIRHAPLQAAVILAQWASTLSNSTHGNTVRRTVRDCLYATMQRADEITEVLAMAGGKSAPEIVFKSVRQKLESTPENGGFDEYQFGKYKGTGKAVTLYDAVRLTHPNPEINPLVQKIYDGALEIPNTWEARLSSGEDAKAVFTELLIENKLGAMALLRNLRKMSEVKVSHDLIAGALERANWRRVLPFRFVSAVLAAPRFSRPLDDAFRQAVSGSPRLPGRTAVLVDHSGSMNSRLSQRSEVHLRGAGNALAAAVNGEDVGLYAWASTTRSLPLFGGLSDAIGQRADVGHGTNLGQALNAAARNGPWDRYIVISDLQLGDRAVPTTPDSAPVYAINVGPYAKPGLIHGKCHQISGFSAATLKWIAEIEGGA